MRLLEQHNPDVTFDWPRLLKGNVPVSSGSPGPGAPGPGARSAREERRRERRDQRRPRPDPVATTQPVVAIVPAASVTDPEAIEEIDELDEMTGADTPSDLPGALDVLQPHEPLELLEPFDPHEPEPFESDAVPGPAHLTNAEPVEPRGPGKPHEPVPEVAVDEPLAERYVRLGADGLSRLRARYADVKARIEAKPLEEPERAELMTRADRLNPDAWSTDEAVSAALEEYEAVFESLRAVIGRQPRGRRP